MGPPGSEHPPAGIAGLCELALWERALPAKGSEAPGRIPETWFFGCSVLRIRDAVQWWCLPGPLKSSLIAVSLALPGQTAPSRHHHCPAHFAAAPPRVQITARTILRSSGCGSLPCKRKAGLPAGRIPERLLALKLEKSLASCGATFAGSFAPFRGHGPLAQGNFLQAWLPQGLFPQTELRRKVRAVSLTRGGGRFASARCRAALPGTSPLMEGPHHPMDAVTGR